VKWPKNSVKIVVLTEMGTRQYVKWPKNSVKIVVLTEIGTRRGGFGRITEKSLSKFVFEMCT